MIVALIYAIFAKKNKGLHFCEDLLEKRLLKLNLCELPVVEFFLQAKLLN